jgi:hypothetical protein
MRTTSATSMRACQTHGALLRNKHMRHDEQALMGMGWSSTGGDDEQDAYNRK